MKKTRDKSMCQPECDTRGTLVMQHHGNSHGLLCSELYHQAWRSVVFSSRVAGFLGQPATRGCCTAYWANISLEGS